MVDWREVAHIRMEIDQLWKHEEQFWGQRSRVKWLNFGDKNTKFFHASTIQRRNRNKLLRIKDGADNWLEGQNEVINGMSNFYNALYTPEPSTQIDQCLRVVPSCVTTTMNMSSLILFL